MAFDDSPIFRALAAEYAAGLGPAPTGRHRWVDEPTEPITVPTPMEASVSFTDEPDQLRPAGPHTRVEVLPRTSVLNRHVVHDERSRAHPLPDRAVPTERIIWPRRGPVFDQNAYLNGAGLGCCTACAGYGLLMTGSLDTGRTFTDEQVQDLYHLETLVDETEIPGVWPPNDTGSAGLWLMKSLQQLGLIESYRHAFTVRAALAALRVGPIAVGTSWLESMNDPYRGVLRVDPRSELEGGHEYDIRGWDPHGRGWVLLQNSWGTGWGVDVEGAGAAWIELPAFAWLLSQQGDVVQPKLKATKR